MPRKTKFLSVPTKPLGKVECEGFDWKQESKAAVWVTKQEAKGLKVWNFTEGTDSYALLAAKRLPTKKEAERSLPEVFVEGLGHQKRIKSKDF
jgi:hypothetical protein